VGRPQVVQAVQCRMLEDRGKVSSPREWPMPRNSTAAGGKGMPPRLTSGWGEGRGEQQALKNKPAMAVRP